jgi:hypothetical protein
MVVMVFLLFLLFLCGVLWREIKSQQKVVAIFSARSKHDANAC